MVVDAHICVLYSAIFINVSEPTREPTDRNAATPNEKNLKFFNIYVSYYTHNLDLSYILTIVYHKSKIVSPR